VPTGFRHVAIAKYIYSHKMLNNYQQSLEEEDREGEQARGKEAQV
jgi:hypothetical protein